MERCSSQEHVYVAFFARETSLMCNCCISNELKLLEDVYMCVDIFIRRKSEGGVKYDIAHLRDQAFY